MIYPLSAMRALALHAQALVTPNGEEREATRDNLDSIGQQIAAVQIDTLHVVHRAQYLTLWSRFGNYDPAEFDALSYDPHHRRWFEGWFHKACYIPLKDYRYRIPSMRHARENPALWAQRFLARAGTDILDEVLHRIRQEGPLRVSEFEGDGKKRASWWDWKPAKYALEYLFACGDLMISDRVKFQRVYDLRERVLPDGVDTTEPTPDEVMRHTLERLVKAAGASQPSRSLGRIMGNHRAAQQVTETLLQEGVFVEIQIEKSLPAEFGHNLLLQL